MKFVVSRRPIV